MGGSDAQLVAVIFGGVNVLINGFLLWVVTDLRNRIARLEDLEMKRK